MADYKHFVLKTGNHLAMSEVNWHIIINWLQYKNSIFPGCSVLIFSRWYLSRNKLNTQQEKEK